MSKHDDRKQLEAGLKQFRGPLDLRPALVGADGKPMARPPQDPIVAALQELHRIAQKAARGLSRQELETMPRYPVGTFVSGPPVIDWSEQ